MIGVVEDVAGEQRLPGWLYLFVKASFYEQTKLARPASGCYISRVIDRPAQPCRHGHHCPFQVCSTWFIIVHQFAYP